MLSNTEIILIIIMVLLLMYTNIGIVLIAIMVLIMFTKKREYFNDSYAIKLHADSINRMKRWDQMHSRKFSHINDYLPQPTCQKTYLQ